ncbi:MAG: twin-arginine translocase TatA/TatE family subunit [Planctomycetes bacterium]|nr:twin-arginine translocase TatA/TatE family subunit [Planctomycetota bacterium]
MKSESFLALFSMPGTTEWIIILVVALLVFGRRLPDVARSLGKSIVEFKKGIREVKDDIEQADRPATPAPPRLEQRTGESSTPSATPTPPGPQDRVPSKVD